MNYLAVISKAGENYSGWLLDFAGAIMATAKTADEVATKLAQGLVSYAEEVDELPTARVQNLSDEDLAELEDVKLIWVMPAEQNPVSLELARVLEQSGLYGAEVARRMGVPRQTVTRMVNPFYWGHNVSSLRRFAEAVGGKLEVKVEIAA